MQTGRELVGVGVAGLATALLKGTLWWSYFVAFPTINTAELFWRSRLISEEKFPIILSVFEVALN